MRIEEPETQEARLEAQYILPLASGLLVFITLSRASERLAGSDEARDSKGGGI